MIAITHRIFMIACLLMVWSAFTFAVAHAGVASKQQEIPPEKIRDAIERFIKQKAPWDPKQISIQKLKFNRTLVVPSGKIALRIRAPRHSDWLGTEAFGVRVQVDEIDVAGITVPAYLAVWSDVIMTTKPLGRFEPIDRDDIQIQKMDLARAPSGALVNIDQVLGRRANRNIAANCILRRTHVELPPIIKRGDLVKVVAESDLLKITVKALAKEDGRQGDRIKVINLRSKRVIYASVVDGQTVQVEF